MIKILHSADWHLDAPLRSFTPEQRRFLREQQLRLPGLIVDTAIAQGCDLMLLSGDLFDSHSYTPEGFQAVFAALGRAGMPVFIAPGNHDFYCDKSPWARELWPENVYIFKTQEITSYRIPALSCRVYGAAFRGMDCPGLLDGFCADAGPEQHALMVLHGDPSAPDSPYCPVTAVQVKQSGLDYLALGHVHTPGRFGTGAGMCAWPGCPMGRGYDETGVKGVLVAELDRQATIRFLPLNTPRFYDQSVPAGDDPRQAIADALPGGGSTDFLRLHLTGAHPGLDLVHLAGQFPGYPNLKLLDETTKTPELWDPQDENTLEGIYFRLLRQRAYAADPQTKQDLELAAALSRQLLQGREVELP